METKAVIDKDRKVVEIYGKLDTGKWWLRYSFEVNELEVKEETK